MAVDTASSPPAMSAATAEQVLLELLVVCVVFD